MRALPRMSSHARNPRHVFVVGDDDFNQRRLRSLEASRGWRFHRIMDYDTTQHPSLSVREMLERAVRGIDEAGAPVGGICSYWDFPQMAMVSVLAERYGRPAPRLESVVRCQHKYYSRVEQAKVVPEHTPRFVPVDPEAHRLRDLDLDLPFWIKPVRAHSSQLGFRVDDERDFERAMSRIRPGIGRFSGATNEVLRMSRLPEELAHVHGGWCVAEALISGEDCRQCTAEGFAVSGEEPVVYGIVDSLTYPGVSSFSRYQYPSTLPEPVKARIREASIRLVSDLGFRDGAFNVEFFWNRSTDALMLLEINARTSQSHADLFRWVDGVSNLETVVRLCLGERPEGVHHDGEHPMAAKCFHRAFRDAEVKRVPTEAEIEAVEREIPGTKVQIPPRGRRRLSDMLDQDSYSYELALIHVGATDEAEIQDKLDRVVERLSFELVDPESGRPIPPEEYQEVHA